MKNNEMKKGRPLLFGEGVMLGPHWLEGSMHPRQQSLPWLETYQVYQQYNSPSDASTSSPNGNHNPQVSLKFKTFLNLSIRPGLDRPPCFPTSPICLTTFSDDFFYL